MKQRTAGAVSAVGAATAKNLREYLAGEQIKQKVLVDRLGLTETYVSRRLTGEVSMSVDDLAMFTVALGISASEVLPNKEEICRLTVGRSAIELRGTIARVYPMRHLRPADQRPRLSLIPSQRLG